MPSLNPEEVFEDHYTRLFRERFEGRGVELTYIRDRAATDIGFHLTHPGSLEFSGVKVWFQLKGVHATTLSAAEAEAASDIGVQISVDHLRFWYAAPEATYLIVYIEALDRFVADDVRDIVERQWGPDFLHKQIATGQKKVTVRIPTANVLDDDRIRAMLRHRSMRIDGPPWRGRPLGHRLDPLRCELQPLVSAQFDALVDDLLAAHGFWVLEELVAGDLVEGGRARLCVGTLYNTWEWVFSGGTEFGFDKGTDFRLEGQLMHAHGKVGVLIHSEIEQPIRAGKERESVWGRLEELDVEKLLIFSNAPDLEVFGAYRSIAGSLFTPPQGLASLAFNVLVATLVYLDHRESLTWRNINYR